MAEKQFLVSVADAYIFDNESDALILKGKTLLNSSMEQAMNNQEIYGGKGSKIQFELNFQKSLNFTIEDAEFNVAYICMQNNASIVSQLSDYLTVEDVTFDATGKATLTETPVGKVYVEMENGTHLTVVPTVKDIDVPTLANKTAKVAYQYSTTMDTITISGETFPKAYRLVLNADIYGASGKTHELQITAPKFKPDGALSLSMAHDGVSTSALNGKTLADNDGNYAYIGIKSIGASQVQLVAIACNTSEVALNATETEQLTVYGIRGGQYANIVNPTGTTFTSSDPAIATVDSTGLVTYVATGTCKITIENGLLSDTVDVTCL